MDEINSRYATYDDETIENEIQKLKDRGILVPYEVPMKTGDVRQYDCLSWFRFYKEKFNKSRKNIRDDMMRITQSGLYTTQLEWPEEVKIKNTESFAKFCEM